MTTLVQTAREPLQILSMSNNHNPERRYSKRLAATSVYEEQDGDFVFSRAPKRLRTAEPEPESEPEPSPAPLPVRTKTKKTVSSRTRKQPRKDDSPPPHPTRQQEIVLPKRQTRRTSSIPPEDVEPPAKRPTTRRRTRASVVMEEEEPAPIPTKPAPSKRGRKSKEPTSSHKSRPPSQKQQADIMESIEDIEDDDAMDMVRGGHHNTSMDTDNEHQQQKISLPFSDTPVMNRNKEMRRKAGTSGRRSSLGMRGRRASSLIENGQTALPHREVAAEEFFKHIADGQLETRRMKQLLTWCGERALSEKPPLGTGNANAVLGARAIQDQLLKDFQNKPRFSDWFGRDEAEASKPKRPTVTEPNPKNIEHERRVVELEARIERLREEKRKWLSLAKNPPILTPLFPVLPPTADTTASQLPQSATTKPSQPPLLPPQTLPALNPSDLDPTESAILSQLSGPSSSSSPTSSFPFLRARAEDKLQSLQHRLEHQVDIFADGVHKLEQRVVTGGREADRLLGQAQGRLREREEWEVRGVGTERVPMIEVLRSLGRMLPEGRG